MGDMIEDFRAMKELQKDQKTERYNATITMLNEKGIGYQKGKSRNIIVAGRYELWPSTHAWFDRKSGRRGRGIDGFMTMIEEGPK